MRNNLRLLLLALVIVAVGSGCDPLIHKFEVVPDKLQCPGNVTLTWQGDADGLGLNADHPVVPATPQTLPKSGSKQEKVTQTTEFSLFYPGAGHREKTVTVTNVNCGGGGSCGPTAITLNGQCFNANSGPSYETKNVSVAVAPGNLTNLTSDADFPVHVQHAGNDIALGVGGGPIFPLPPGIPAAGSYTVTVPGQVGLQICAGAGPTGGGTIVAPPVTLHITPTCPKP